jgi:hypothetical protein
MAFTLPVQVPNRTGEGFAGIDRFSSNKYNLADCLNQIAQNLADVNDASQEADFAAFKAAMALIDVLQKSDDSKI